MVQATGTPMEAHLLLKVLNMRLWYKVFILSDTLVMYIFCALLIVSQEDVFLQYTQHVD